MSDFNQIRKARIISEFELLKAQTLDGIEVITGPSNFGYDIRLF
jgi:hypothetical protein